MRGRPCGLALGGACVGAAFLLGTAAPASAYGPLLHALAAERAFSQVVVRHPWLAPHRDAYLWGAVAADIDRAPGALHLSRGRTHAGSTLAVLWREAVRTDPVARAFVLGWAAHLGADEAEASAATSHQQPHDDERDLSLDAALLPGASAQLQGLSLAAWRHAGGAPGASIQAVVLRPLGLDEATYRTWAGLNAAMAGRGPDRYVRERARFLRLDSRLDALLEPGARTRLGDPVAIVTAASQAARDATLTLLTGPPPVK